MSGKPSTTGIPEIDRLTGGILEGDNIVWEVDSGTPVDEFVSRFIRISEEARHPVVYISFNRSPQTIAARYGQGHSPAHGQGTGQGVGQGAGQLMAQDRFVLLDCFASGKGNRDPMFLNFFKAPSAAPGCQVVHVEEPSDPARLQEAVIQLRHKGKTRTRYIFDSLTGMLDLWGDEDRVIRFFGHICPRLYDLDTIAYWLLEKEAHSEAFLAKVRHITQVVLEVSVAQGGRSLTVRKAAGRKCSDIGVPRRFELSEAGLTITEESREGRELSLLNRMVEVLGSALKPDAFFEQTFAALGKELGMARGAMVLLDKATNKLRIAAAHGLTPEERRLGEYAVGEGVTGHVVETGRPEIIPDIGQDPRFLYRTRRRQEGEIQPIAFICVPVKLDNEVVGALSVDRPFAGLATLEKDLRLLSIVAAIIAQVLKINRLIQVEKEELLVRDQVQIRELRNRYRLDNVIGESEATRKVLSIAATAARSKASVLITGETGTGKEMIANVVHYNSDRAAGPYIKVNCGALPEGLLESELFGHIRGSFTGAVRDRKGRFELAHGGTLFLDEVAEMTPRLQVKLLRVLQEGEFEPVGGARTLTVDVRVVAATSRDLKDEIRKGAFRKDLYYRLNVIPIPLPPLRERREDIPLLVNHFLDTYNRENKRHVRKMSRKLLYQLLEYPWPGNVRELENCIEHAVVMSAGESFTADLLPAEIQQAERSAEAPPSVPVESGGNAEAIRRLAAHYCAGAGDLAVARETLTGLIEEAAIRAGQAQKLSQRDLAHRLGLSRMTLRKRMRRLAL